MIFGWVDKIHITFSLGYYVGNTEFGSNCIPTLHASSLELVEVMVIYLTSKPNKVFCNLFTIRKSFQTLSYNANLNYFSEISSMLRDYWTFVHLLMRLLKKNTGFSKILVQRVSLNSGWADKLLLSMATMHGVLEMDTWRLYWQRPSFFVKNVNNIISFFLRVPIFQENFYFEFLVF